MNLYEHHKNGPVLQLYVSYKISAAPGAAVDSSSSRSRGDGPSNA